MKLETRDGRSFSLRVERYEFPDEELGPTEDNPADDFDTGRFLVVAASFRNAGSDWSASGPVMTTTEVGRFVDWMDSIVKGHPLSTGVYFTGRDLEFTIDHDARNLLVHACRDFRPDWSTTADVTIEFAIDQVDLRVAAESLRSQLKCFPGRPPIQVEP
jgi:hypothetical protein